MLRCSYLKFGRSREAITNLAARQYVNGWDAGREAGRAEAQKFLRLMLGIDLPDMDERAYWMCPFPLMPEPKEKS